ncbi:TetR/AcrR family transcriptional regulator [Flexivirga sp. ID2601S]|uniref:TetR/AcrR family transcriptional regulator n=1 Tax=Flexivirga aerilata TaxID=1656889 RepID=A0A849AGT5_9MICO|nr:TetR/AcrR family transcriptional regulator [Flexivirga aerilata]NNG40054.1 TetR/AcrR family transcriptional regulator [Flexivirga aerilata]
MATKTPEVRRRPGGRSARVQNAVYDAVGELMARERPDHITIPMVAERAGVNPTSIYRRWGDADALLEEVAVAAFTRDDERVPDTGSFAGDLREWARVIARDITRPHRTRYLRALVAARDGLVEQCPCWTTREEQLAEMTALARTRDERTPGVEQVLNHVIAPLYHHVVFGLPVDDELAQRLVDDVLSMTPRDEYRDEYLSGTK